MSAQDNDTTPPYVIEKFDVFVPVVSLAGGCAYLAVGKWAFENGHIGSDAYALGALFAGFVFTVILVYSIILVIHWFQNYRAEK